MIRVNDEWRYTEPRVRVSGEWVGFVRVWQRIDGQWVVVQDNWTWSLFELEWESDQFWNGIERSSE